jgi:hypothetical protein
MPRPNSARRRRARFHSGYSFVLPGKDNGGRVQVILLIAGVAAGFFCSTGG